MGSSTSGPLKQKGVSPRMEKETISGLLSIRSSPTAFIKGKDQRKHRLLWTLGRRFGPLVETGHTAFRTSIQWSRIFPEGRGEISKQALISTVVSLKDKGERDSPLGQPPIIYLPMALQEQGMVGKIKKPLCLPKEYAFCSRPMVISGSPLMNHCPVEFGYF